MSEHTFEPNPAWPPPQPARPARRRISGRWFWAPGISLFLSLILFVVMFIPLFGNLFTVTDRVPLDGQWHRVSVPADEQMAVYLPSQSLGSCQARTTGGDPVALSAALGGANRTLSGTDYRMQYSFRSEAENLEFACTGEGVEAQISPAPVTVSSMGWFLAALTGSVLFGLAGFVGLIIVLVRYAASRR